MRRKERLQTHGCRDRGDVYGPAPPLPFLISRRAHGDHERSFGQGFSEKGRTGDGWYVGRIVPIALKFCTDGAGTGTEEVVTDDPVALVFEHALVERFDVASVSS